MLPFTVASCNCLLILEASLHGAMVFQSGKVSSLLLTAQFLANHLQASVSKKSLSAPFDGLSQENRCPLVPSNRKPTSLFISYAHFDGAELALRLATDLSAKGF